LANPSSAYVVPAGRYLFAGLTGEDPSGTDEWRGAADIFNTGDSRGPFGTVSDAWNARRLGLGVLDAPAQVTGALDEATQRYFGGANNGSWSDRWNQWFATDVTGPDGNTLLSPYHQTGLRVGQDYGVGRDAQGQLAGPIGGDIFQGFAYAQNKLAQSPYLDPTNALSGYNAAMTGSPFAEPNVQRYVRSVRDATGGPDAADAYGQRGLGQVQGLADGTDFDQYGLRGIDQTNALAHANLQKLTRNIDTEAQDTLAMKLPEIGAAMQAAGLGRSGAAQQQMLQANNDILSQANRDKMSLLADFQDRDANRQAAAINLATQQGFAGQGQKYGSIADAMNLGSQIGAQGYENYAGRMGNAAMQGLNDQFTMNEGNRAGARSLWQQSMDQQAQRYGIDSGNYLNALIGSGQFQNASLDQERLGQSAALSDYMNLVGQREGWRTNAQNDMLSLADREQSYRQERLNQQLDAGMSPLDMLLRIATGTTAPSAGNYARTSPWGQMGQQALGSFAGGVANQAGEQVGPWLSGLMGFG
jgi:hypothetical protein